MNCFGVADTRSDFGYRYDSDLTGQPDFTKSTSNGRFYWKKVESLLFKVNKNKLKYRIS
ncbi:hypothetical protein AtNW77_Chr2g0240981 [Arabidopsis thaliana]